MLFLAFKHLLSRKRQTVLTLLGIVFGAMSYVVITGFFLGFRHYFLEQLINNDAHIHIYAREDIIAEHSLDKDFFGSTILHAFWAAPPAGRRDSARIENPPEWYERLNNDPRVEAFSPQLTSQVVMRQAKSSVTATLIGCDPTAQVNVTNVEKDMQEGKMADLAAGGNRIVVGEGLLQKLGARVSQTVMVNSGTGDAVPFKIVGYFRTGIKPVDDVRAYGSLGDVQRIAGSPSEVNEIVVRIKDLDDANSMATTWSSLSIDKVQSWDQINESFFSVFKIQDATRYLMICVVLIVAGFGIYNVLNMTVTQKHREIAILRSMGYETKDIVNLFVYQGLTLGIIGGLIGIFCGYWICRYLQTIPFGGGPMGGAGYLQILITPGIYIEGMLLGLVSACAASILPALAAGRLTPIEIIRSGTE